MGAGRFNRDEMIQRQEARDKQDELDAARERRSSKLYMLAFLAFVGLAVYGFVQRDRIITWVKQAAGLEPALGPAYAAELPKLLESFANSPDAGLISIRVEGVTLKVTVSSVAWASHPVDTRRQAVERWHEAYHSLRARHGLPNPPGAYSPVEVRDNFSGLRARYGKTGAVVLS